jgi:FkbH-like protein
MAPNAPPNGRALFRQISDLVKQSGGAEALRLLSDSIRNGKLDAEECERAGRLIPKLRAAAGESIAPARILILGQCTTSWIASNLTAEACGRGSAVDVREGEYDNVIQELMTPPTPDRIPQVVVLLPWTQRLFHSGGNRSPEERIEEEVGFWKQAWDLAADKTGARILQVGYDWVMPGALGHHLAGAAGGDVSMVRKLNEALRSAAPRGSFFLDLEQISGLIGRDRFYDLRRYFWTKQPFSEAGAQQLAIHLWSGVRALMTGPKKVLVVDLDNTLWGGVVGETGPLDIALGETPDGEAYRAFQRHLKALSKRGVVLTICSKNNREDALAPFEKNPQMELSLSDFAHIEASWDPKSEGLRRTADALNLGLDSFVFFDDNPAEREQIRQSWPDVEVVEAPAEPSEYVRALERGLWFEATELSREDSQRSGQYQQENQRREAQKAFASMEDYLQSLEMIGCVRPIDETTMQRVVQLIAKTNQFNLTTRRHSHEDVQRLLSLSDSIGLVLSLADKFGDHGLVSVLLAAPQADAADKTLRIDTWLMSCRVIGRTAEEFLFNGLLERARELGYRSLEGEFIATKKNAMVADLYDRLQFERLPPTTDAGVVGYRCSLPAKIPARTFIQAPPSGSHA